LPKDSPAQLNLDRVKTERICPLVAVHAHRKGELRCLSQPRRGSVRQTDG
jgi:hypothetical protein